MPHDNTERVGVNAVEAIFLGFNWTFRPQVISDYGIDAQVEVWDHDKVTRKLLALQIKSGASYFKKKGDAYVFHGELRHLDYWTPPSACVPHHAQSRHRAHALAKGRAPACHCN